MKCEQQRLDLFDPVSFDELVAMECPGGLHVTASPRLSRGWHVRCTGTGSRVLTVPACFTSAPEQVKRALVSWALLPLRSRRHRAIRRDLEKSIWTYAESVRLRPRFAEKQWSADAAHGCRYNLREVFAGLNCRYFSNSLTSLIRWGRHASTTSYQQFTTTTEGKRISLITIAGAYDGPDVPVYAIEGVVFHEMAHEACPPKTVNGRRVIHGREFRAVECRYEFFDQWRSWEKEHLRTNPRRRRRVTWLH